MIRNYIIIAVRNISKNKIFLAINVIGLGAALTCCIIAYLTWKFNQDFNVFHTEKDKIFKINSFKEINGQKVPFSVVPLPLGEVASNELANVADFTRYATIPVDLKFGSDLFNTQIGYADKNFLDIFTFHLKEGDPQALHDHSKILISESLAEKHFPDVNPIGQQITIQQKNGEMVGEFIVGGILKEIPLNSSFRFEALLPYENFIKLTRADEYNWAMFSQNTFLLLNDPSKKVQVEQGLSKYIAIQNKASEDWPIAQFYLEPLTTMAKSLHHVRASNLSPSLPEAAVIAPMAMGLLILLLACFNFINTAIVTSNKRFKEIGIRKTFGSQQIQIIFQFLTENILICTIALFFALGLSYFMVPAYSALWNFLDIDLNFQDNWQFIIFLFVLLLFTGILAGAYPAFYISTLKPVNIFRDNFSVKRTTKFTRILLTLQFSIALVTINTGIIFTQNATFQETLSLGFTYDQMIALQVKDNAEYLNFRNKIQQNPKIFSVSGARHHIGFNQSNMILKSGSKQQNIEGYFVEHNYLETAGLRLLEGRPFQQNSETDIRESIIVTEQLVKEFGWDNPIGQKIIANDTIPLYVIGVIEDIYAHGFWEPVHPLFLRMMSEEASPQFLIVKVGSNNSVNIFHYLEDTWKEMFPEIPFRGVLQEEMLHEAKVTNENIRTIFFYLAVVSTLLATSGLFTMVSLNIIRRMKELGIRKILGASTAHIAYTINKEFIFILCFSGIIGSFIAYFFVHWLLNSIYVYHIEPKWVAFLLSVLLIIVVSGLTVGVKVAKAASSNPVNNLRNV